MTRRSDQPDDQDQAPAGNGQGQGDQQQMVEYNAEVLAARPGLAEQFLAMLAQVPAPDTGDATAAIAQTLLEAESAEDLNRPWESDGMRDYFGQVVIVHGITQRPSDYKDGLPVYMGCDCTIEATGERKFVSCGSVAAVVALVRAHALSLFPVRVEPTRAKKATPRGYWPYHLAFLVPPRQAAARVIDQEPQS